MIWWRKKAANIVRDLEQNCEHSCKRLKCALGADIFAYLSGKMCNKLKSSVCSSCCTMCSGCIYRNCIICVARPRYRIFPIKDEWIYAISISIQSHCHAWWDIPIWVKKKSFKRQVCACGTIVKFSFVRTTIETHNFEYVLDAHIYV